MRSMELVDIRIEPNNEWNQKMESLKNKWLHTISLGASKTMDGALREAVVAGNIDDFIKRLEGFVLEKKLAAGVILEQPSPIGNTLLHVAADLGKFEIAQLLAHHFPNLLTKTNDQGDTALHLAARAKKLQTVEVLVNIARTLLPDVDAFLRMKNENGNTALHEAVMQETQEAASTAVIQERNKVAHCLIQADREAAYFVNKDGKSPLYLAAELGNESMLTLLLEEIASDDYAVLEKLKGEKSPVHAALLNHNKVMLEEIATKKPELLQYIDKNGKSPFHHAAFVGYLEGIKFLVEKKADGALSRDNNGFYPIHEACKKGHVEVVKLLLGQWCDPREFLTREGKNIFHVAAENGRATVVKDLLVAPNVAPFVRELVNKKDNKGNAPLHLASSHARSNVVFALVRNPNVDNKLKNGADMTAYDLAVEQSRLIDSGSSEKHKLEAKGKVPDSELEDPKALMLEDDQKGSFFSRWAFGESYERMMTVAVFKFAAHATLSDKLRVQPQPPTKEQVSASINSLMIVATVVASATFTAGVAMPSWAPEKDKDTTDYRDSFALCNTISMNLAIAAAIILCWAQQVGMDIASLATRMVSWLVGGSLYMLCFALLFAVLIAVGKETKMAVLVFAIVIWFTVSLAVLFVPLVTPSSIGEILALGLFWFSFSSRKIVGRLGKDLLLRGDKNTSYLGKKT